MRLPARCVAVAIVLLLAAACGRDSPPPQPDGKPQATTPAEQPDSECRLTMGWDPWPPFHYAGVGGEMAGFDAELVRAMARDAGCELDFERDSWATLLARVRDGSVDLITGATITEARSEFAIFSEPFREEEFGLYIRTGEAGRWSADTLRELMEQGFRIGVTDAYVYGDTVQELLDDPDLAAQVHDSRFGEANISRLLEREIDGFIDDVFAATTMIRRLGYESAISQHSMSLGPRGEVRIMYSQASVSPELVERLNESLANLKESGEYEAIERRYLD